MRGRVPGRGRRGHLNKVSSVCDCVEKGLRSVGHQETSSLEGTCHLPQSRALFQINTKPDEGGGGIAREVVEQRVEKESKMKQPERATGLSN